jgi:hypothetical protein
VIEGWAPFQTSQTDSHSNDGYISNSTCILVMMMIMLFIILNIKMQLILMFIVMQTIMKFIIIVMMKKLD